MPIAWQTHFTRGQTIPANLVSQIYHPFSDNKQTMKASEILKLQNIEEQVKRLSTTGMDQSLVKLSYTDCGKQWDPTKHTIMDQAIRPKKEIRKDSGRKDSTGAPIPDITYQDVARIAVPFQKVIVRRAVSFLLNKGVNIQSNAETDDEKKVVEIISKVWSDNKLSYLTKQLARITMSECEAAEIWYLQEDMSFWRRLMVALKLQNVKYRIRVRVVGNSLGDTLYPHFDETGDMDAFSRSYTVTDSEGKTVQKFEIYTAEKIIFYAKMDGLWVPDPAQSKPVQANALKKIPVVYYSQELPEWNDVQLLIERFETMLSNFADANDYYGSPITIVKGKVKGFSQKGEQGKVLEIEGDGSVSNLVWDQAPETIKLEKESIEDLIYSLTQTPDISFGKMMNMGNVSGVSRRLMFMDAHLKCFDKEETFGQGIQRRLNIMKTMIGFVANKFSETAENIEVWPEFTPYLPSADEDLVNSLSVAVGGQKIMSQDTAVKKNPYVDDPEAEMKKIQYEDAVEFQGVNV